jgi:transposase
VADLIPDELWDQVSPLMPVHVPSPRGGGPRTITDRQMTALLVGRHVAGLPWAQIPARDVTLRGRLAEWEAAGVWPKVRELAAGHGHLAGLVQD